MGESAPARTGRGVSQQVERGGPSLSGVRAAVSLGVAGGVERADAGCIASRREAAGAGAPDRAVPAGLLAVYADQVIGRIPGTDRVVGRLLLEERGGQRLLRQPATGNRQLILFTRTCMHVARQCVHGRKPDRQPAYTTGWPPRWRDAALFARQRAAVLGRRRTSRVAIARGAHLRSGLFRGVEGAGESATRGR